MRTIPPTDGVTHGDAQGCPHDTATFVCDPGIVINTSDASCCNPNYDLEICVPDVSKQVDVDCPPEQGKSNSWMKVKTFCPWGMKTMGSIGKGRVALRTASLIRITGPDQLEAFERAIAQRMQYPAIRQ